MNIATILCNCKGEISAHLDLEKTKKYCLKQPDVKFAVIFQAACSINDQEDLSKEIKAKDIDALLFIGCSPKYYEKHFQDIFFEKSDINPGLIKFVNVREQLSWAHRDQKEDIIREKAFFLILAGLENLRLSKNIKTEIISNLKSILVLGGGISGMHSAMVLANQGYDVYLVEKEPYLGGKQLRMSKAFPRDECSACAITPVINEVARTKNIEILTLSEIIKVRGRTGNYIISVKKQPRFVKESCNNCGQCFDVCPKSIPDEFNYNLKERKVISLPNFEPYPRLPFIKHNDIKYCREECKKLCVKVCDVGAINLDEEDTEIEINVGGIITAIGYDMYQPSEYGYGHSKDILTLEEYERLLVSNGIYDGKILKPSNQEPPKDIAFILCVGARQPNKVPYCSRYCCMATSTAIKQTVEKLPESKIYVFYRDIYALGKMGEDYIKEVQNYPNVEWIRAVPEYLENGPTDKESDSELLKLKINVSGGKLTIPFDMIVLATPMIPNKDTDSIREIFGLSKTPEGFFKEADVMLAPVSTYDEGKYLAGSCIGPRTINESIVDGYAAAASISRVLSDDEITQFVMISDVDETICGGEGICVKTCFFHACTIDTEKKISVVDPTLCRGCGNCVAACPTGARDLLIYPTESFYSSIDILSQYTPPEGPKLLGLLCNGCAYPAADQVGLSGKTYPINLSIMRVPCSGRIDPRFILYALEKGFDGVLLGACHPENCHYIGGNYDLSKRVDLLKDLLRSRNINDERIKLVYISYLEGDRFVNNVNDFINVLNSE